VATAHFGHEGLASPAVTGQYSATRTPPSCAGWSRPGLATAGKRLVGWRALVECLFPQLPKLRVSALVEVAVRLGAADQGGITRSVVQGKARGSASLPRFRLEGPSRTTVET
jgi:hypothetical protein